MSSRLKKALISHWILALAVTFVTALVWLFYLEPRVFPLTVPAYRFSGWIVGLAISALDPLLYRGYFGYILLGLLVLMGYYLLGKPSRQRFGPLARFLARFLFGIFMVFSMILVFIWSRSWSCFLDDGPFTGEPRASSPVRPPDGKLRIWCGMKVKTWNRIKGEKAPTVLLEDRQGNVKWCIYATGMEKTHVEKLSLDEYTACFYPPRLRGSVVWTYGHEGAWFLISPMGELKAYYYSW